MTSEVKWPHAKGAVSLRGFLSTSRVFRQQPTVLMLFESVQPSPNIMWCCCCSSSVAAAHVIAPSTLVPRWKKENEPNRHKSSPKKLESEGKGDNNDPAWQVVQAQLVPCPSCGRTFFPERLPIHQRVCKGKPNPNSLSRNSSFREQSSQQCDEEGDKPNIYVPCYICSRSFGSWVIQMHESQCLRKWRRENEKLPEELQQPEPHKPQLVLSDDGQIDWDSTEDDVAWESHLQQLVPCPRCGRTFFPDRLQVHGRSCKGPSNSKHPQSNKGT